MEAGIELAAPYYPALEFTNETSFLDFLGKSLTLPAHIIDHSHSYRILCWHDSELHLGPPSFLALSLSCSACSFPPQIANESVRFYRLFRLLPEESMRAVPSGD